MLTKRKRKSRPWLVHVPSLDNPHIFQTLQDTGSLPVSLFPGLGCLSMVFRSFGGAVVGSGWVLGSIKVLPLRYAILRVNSGVISEALRPRYDHALTSFPLLAQRQRYHHHHQCNKVWKEAFIPIDDPYRHPWRSVFRMRMERTASSKQQLLKCRK